MSQGTLIGIDQLVLGATTSCDLVDQNGSVAISTGTTITPKLLQGIKAAGIAGLIAGRPDYVSQHINSRQPTLEVISSRIAEMQRRSGIMESLSANTLMYARGALEKTFRLIMARKLPDPELLNDLVDRILHDIELFSAAPLPAPRKYHDSLLDCIIDCAIDCAVIAGWHFRDRGFSDADIRAGTLGALLKDSGMLLVPREILEKTENFNHRDFTEIARHPYLGLRSLSPLNKDLPKITQDIILLHHEKEDGTGYPLKRSGDTLSTPVKLIHIIDAYVALVSPRPHRSPVTPHKAMKTLLRDAGRSFDKRMLGDFIKRTGIYPLGCTVILSSNEIGVVVGMGRGGPYKPVVDVYYSNHHQFSTTPQRIDLGRDKLKYIRRVVK